MGVLSVNYEWDIGLLDIFDLEKFVKGFLKGRFREVGFDGLRIIKDIRDI